jgi:hypothetical protein
MADAQLLTTNAAGTGWVDDVPGAISTGYQAQNTNMTARTLGLDLTSIEITGANITIKAGGVVEKNGVPYLITADKTFEVLGSPENRTFYIELVDGVAVGEQNFAIITDEPVWDSVKNGLYSLEDGRVLNWVIRVPDNFDLEVSRLTNPQNLVTSAGSENLCRGQFGFVRWEDAPLISWRNFQEYIAGFLNGTRVRDLSVSGEFLYILLQDPDGAGGVVAKIDIANPANTTPGILIEIDQVGGFVNHDGFHYIGGLGTGYRGGDIVKYDPAGGAGSEISLFASPDGNPTGLAVIDGNLFSADASTGKIYKHVGITASVEKSFTIGPDIYGLSSYKGMLVVMNRYTGKIQIRESETMNLITEFDFAIPTVPPYPQYDGWGVAVYNDDQLFHSLDPVAGGNSKLMIHR